VDLIWPPGLIPPQKPPTLLYLDLNHWINLSKARLDRKTGARYQGLLEACRRAVLERRVRIVLSGSFVQEFWAIPNPRQRDDLVDLIDELTNFEYLLSLVDVIYLELQATLDEMTGAPGHRYSPLNIVGRGLLYSFGMAGGLRLVDADGRDTTAEARLQGGPEFERRFKDLERTGERMLLAGARDEDIPGMREKGYAPEIPRNGLADNVKIEQAFADTQLNEHWRRGRLRDVLTGREVYLELNEMLGAELAVRKLTLEDVAGNLPDARRLVLSMPSRAVTVELKTGYHRDSRRRWNSNDLYDISAMAVAVPYCDIVFTDAAVRNGLIRAKFDKRMDTMLPRTPDELSAMLDNTHRRAP
jgi:hypothetical protein